MTFILILGWIAGLVASILDVYFTFRGREANPNLPEANRYLRRLVHEGREGRCYALTLCVNLVLGNIYALMIINAGSMIEIVYLFCFFAEIAHIALAMHCVRGWRRHIKNASNSQFTPEAK